MESIWTILGLEPTRDVSGIKRAYVEKAKICHPEEDPQGFLRLRSAYQAALDYAESEGNVSRKDPEPPAEMDTEEPEDGEEDEGWSLSDQPRPLDEGPNPYEDHEAIRSFLELYTGKQRKDPKRWLDYFTSDAFLDIAWERRFAALLLEHVTRLEAEYPVNREFLNWLCAVTVARQRLQEHLFPTGFPMDALRYLPDAVYTQWDYTVVSRDKDYRDHWSIPRELLGAVVTVEILEDLLTQFQKKRIQRLELPWKTAVPVGEEQGFEPFRSLVFLNDRGKYARLCFDDFTAESYALLRMPEVYGKEKGKSEQVPFLRGRLLSNVIHHNFGTIRRQLDLVFRQISGRISGKFMAGRIWTPAEYIHHGRVKYNLDKQLLADFPLERAHNQADAPFFFYYYPDSVTLTDGQDGTETLEVHEWNRLLLQQTLARFFRQGHSRLSAA